MINWICFGNEKHFDSNQKPKITTQLKSENGVPDIVFSNKNKFIIVEVKQFSGLGTGQLFRYQKLLENKQAEGIDRTRLVVLSVFDVLDETVEPESCREIKWAEVQRKFAAISFDNPVLEYLAQQFNSFLKDQVMTVQKVGWQLSEGVRAIVALNNMIGQALVNSGIGTHQVSFGAAWSGYYAKDKQFWVGIYFDTPTLLHFGFENAKPDVDRLTEAGWVMVGNKMSLTLNLASEACHFFAREEESQLAELQRFVKEAYDQAITMFAAQ